MKKINKKFLYVIQVSLQVSLFVLIIFLSKQTKTVDNIHFYRARLWDSELRVGQEMLSSWDVTFAQASTSKSLNCCGDIKPLYGCYGYENLHILGTPLTERAYLGGHFSLFETQINNFINACHGFFARIHLPIRVIHVGHRSLRLTDQVADQIDEDAWQKAKSEIQKTLNLHHLSLSPFTRSGLGDLSILAGWTGTSYSNNYADFIDGCAQCGLILPTSSRGSTRIIGDIPLGYDGHTGFNIVLDTAAGFFDWLTVGLHTENIFFFDAGERIRPPQISQQSGVIRLSDPIFVNMHSGLMWHVSTYIKADHFVDGFSLSFAYAHDEKLCSYAKQYPALNTDQKLNGWSMDVLEFIAEYDFANEDNSYGPRLSLQFNYIIDGKNIFNASSFGAGIGVDIEWGF